MTLVLAAAVGAAPTSAAPAAEPVVALRKDGGLAIAPGGDDVLSRLRGQAKAAVVGCVGAQLSGMFAATLNLLAQEDAEKPLTGFPTRDDGDGGLRVMQTHLRNKDGAPVWLLGCDGCLRGRGAGAEGLFHVVLRASSHLLVTSRAGGALAADALRLLVRRSDHIDLDTAARGANDTAFCAGDGCTAGGAPRLAAPGGGPGGGTWALLDSALDADEAREQLQSGAPELEGIGAVPLPPATADPRLLGDMSKALPASLEPAYVSAVAELRDRVSGSVGTVTGHEAAALIAAAVDAANGHDLQGLRPSFAELLQRSMLAGVRDSALAAYAAGLDGVVKGDEKGAGAPASQAELEASVARLDQSLGTHWTQAVTSVGVQELADAEWTALKKDASAELKRARDAHKAAVGVYASTLRAAAEQEVRAILSPPAEPVSQGWFAGGAAVVEPRAEEDLEALRRQSENRVTELFGAALKWWPPHTPGHASVKREEAAALHAAAEAHVAAARAAEAAARDGCATDRAQAAKEFADRARQAVTGPQAPAEARSGVAALQEKWGRFETSNGVVRDCIDVLEKEMRVVAEEQERACQERHSDHDAEQARCVGRVQMLLSDNPPRKVLRWEQEQMHRALKIAAALALALAVFGRGILAQVAADLRAITAGAAPAPGVAGRAARAASVGRRRP